MGTASQKRPGPARGNRPTTPKWRRNEVGPARGTSFGPGFPRFVAARPASPEGFDSVAAMTRSPLRWLVLAASMACGLAGAQTAAAPGGRWIGTWAAAPQAAFPGPLERYDDRTLRLVVHASVGGPRVRVRLSNAYGPGPLRIAAAHVALRGQGADVVDGSDRALTFGGARDVVIAVGASVTSDPVALDVPPLSDLAVSLHAAGRARAGTTHALAQQTSFVAARHGDFTAATHWRDARKIDAWPFLTGVDVEAPGDGATLVLFGDSWVDGDGSTPDANARWGDALAARLQREGGACTRIGVVNEGLIGNRLLHDSPVRHRPKTPDFGRALGESGRARFDRDVLAQPGARAVLVHLGNNDLGFDGGVAPADETVSLDKLVAAYRELVARAHAAGLRAIASTLTPVEGTRLLPGYDTTAKEALRQRVNAWIRDGGAFDAVIDVDAVVRDPDHPARLLARLASADHLHANDAGYAAAAAAFPPALCADLAAR
jgi:lysophospholipase L1-like esterase